MSEPFDIAHLFKGMLACKPYPSHIEVNPRDLYELLGSLNNYHEQDMFTRPGTEPTKFKGIEIRERPLLQGWRVVSRNYSWLDFSPSADEYKPFPEPINWQSSDFDETEALKREKEYERYRRERGW